MTSSEPPEAIQRGDVVVAENVGPNMTPYFPLLGGLVLDAGALYQHAALVAREYHLPTVILTRDATTTVHEGETITVDGTRGFVELDR